MPSSEDFEGRHEADGFCNKTTKPTPETAREIRELCKSLGAEFFARPTKLDEEVDSPKYISG
ncbi:hypothetical protein KKA95_04805 [Patescibacteria group bacterium]|nr:hypothetical protein [Patescibacteria group bacterium]